MGEIFSFGEWVRRRRKALDLTQDALALRVGCSVPTIRKIEADERRPSAQIAALLANALAVPAGERALFLRTARAELAPDRLAPPAPPELAAPRATHGDLPPRLTSFIGRERDRAGLAELLARPDVRLVTLIGPGGIGKTSLALVVVAQLIDTYPDGVWFVDLAPVSDPGAVAAAIVQTLAVPEVANVPPAERLRDWLRPKQLLLLLDNFEQVIDVAPLVRDLLSAAPQLRVVVTSRIALQLRGEREFPVEPLARPPDNLDPLNIDTLPLQYDAVALFVERAQALQPGFALNSGNAAAVAAICAHLDGLPLAIELAAARIKLFAPPALLAQLRGVGVLDLLRGRARDLPPRQQTMRAAIAWSFDLLSPPEQRLFAQLGVFSGGWTFATAAAVCDPAGGDIADGIEALVEHSLVRPIDAGAEPRFTMLETIRAFALEQLAQAGQIEVLRERHATHFVTLAEDADRALRTAAMISWLDTLEQEHDNLRAALAWSFDATDTSAARRIVGVRIATAIAEFWRIRSYWGDHQRWLQRTPASDELPPPVRARLLFELVYLHRVTWQDAQALACAEASLALFEDLGEPRWATLARQDVALLRDSPATRDAAIALIEQAIAEAEALGDDWLRASVLSAYAQLLDSAGRNAEALRICDEALVLARRVGEPMRIAALLFQRGRIAHGAFAFRQEHADCTEALALARRIGSREMINDCLFGLWIVAGILGDYEAEHALLEELLANSRELGVPLWHASNLAMASQTYIVQGDLATAARYLAESRAIFAAQGQPPTWVLLLALGEHAEQQQEYAKAAAYYAEALDRYPEGVAHTSYLLCRLAYVALAQQDAALALSYGRESVRRMRTHGSLVAWLLECLDGYAAALAANGAHEPAVKLWSASAAFRTQVGYVRPPLYQPVYTSQLAAARNALGADAFDAAWAAGAALSWQQAADEALAIEPNAVAPVTVVGATAIDAQTRELRFAAEIQAGLLPAALPQPSGWQLAALLLPARETSGDFYDCIALPDGRLVLVIADVAGKGLGAALYMATARAILRSLLSFGTTAPAMLLAELNARLLEDTTASLFITTFIGLLDPADGTLTYANAGHPPPLLLSAGGHHPQPLNPTGLVLGIENAATWRDEQCALTPGAQLLLYTDGVTEAQDAAGEFFENERLLAVLRTGDAATLIATVHAAVTAFAGSAPQYDDITLLAVGRSS
jgi:predicted ATPase/transcriptional regulator with XRE-family HTH domain